MTWMMGSAWLSKPPNIIPLPIFWCRFQEISIHISMYLCMYVCICKYIHPYTHITYSSSSIYSNPPSPSPTPTPTPSFIPSATARRWRAPPSPNGAADPNASVRWPGRCSGTLGTCGLDAPTGLEGWEKMPPKKPQVVQVCMFYVLLVMFNIFFVVVHLAATAISMFALALLLCI